MIEPYDDIRYSRGELVLLSPSPPKSIVYVHCEWIEDAYGGRGQYPDVIEASGFRFRRVGDRHNWTLTVPYLWELGYWRYWRAVFKARRWLHHWQARFQRLRQAWKG